MIYRGPGFLAVAFFGPKPTPFPPPLPSASCLFLSLPVCSRSSLLAGEVGGGARGTEAYDRDRKKALSSINRSILSANSCKEAIIYAGGARLAEHGMR
jgi:hypothetical protein